MKQALNPCARLKRFQQATDGAALVEFAIILPVMISLYLGGYQLCDAISAQRKVTTATRAITDLTTQYSSVSNTDLDTVLNAASQIMAPYKTSNARLVVSSVVIDNNGAAKIAWSRGRNATPLTVGSSFTVPAPIKQNGTSLIVANVSYSYVPIAASNLIGRIEMRDQIMMAPRGSSSIGLQQ